MVKWNCLFADIDVKTLVSDMRTAFSTYKRLQNLSKVFSVGTLYICENDDATEEMSAMNSVNAASKRLTLLLSVCLSLLTSIRVFQNSLAETRSVISAFINTVSSVIEILRLYSHGRICTTRRGLQLLREIVKHIESMIYYF